MIVGEIILRNLFRGVGEVILDKEIWVSIAPFKVTSFIFLVKTDHIKNLFS